MTDKWPEIRAWHEVVNRGASGSAATVATHDVTVGGPRGAAEGLGVLEGWIAGAGIHLVPVAWHEVSGRVVVVEEDATWPRRPGADPGAPAIRVATAYAVRDGKVAAILRHDSLEAAMDAARGLAGTG